MKYLQHRQSLDSGASSSTTLDSDAIDVEEDFIVPAEEQTAEEVGETVFTAYENTDCVVTNVQQHPLPQTDVIAHLTR